MASTADSRLANTAMKRFLWQNFAPGTPTTSDSSSSTRPAHACGQRALLVEALVLGRNRHQLPALAVRKEHVVGGMLGAAMLEVGALPLQVLVEDHHARAIGDGARHRLQPPRRGLARCAAAPGAGRSGCRCTAAPPPRSARRTPRASAPARTGRPPRKAGRARRRRACDVRCRPRRCSRPTARAACWPRPPSTCPSASSQLQHHARGRQRRPGSRAGDDRSAAAPGRTRRPRRSRCPPRRCARDHGCACTSASGSRKERSSAQAKTSSQWKGPEWVATSMALLLRHLGPVASTTVSAPAAESGADRTRSDCAETPRLRGG